MPIKLPPDEDPIWTTVPPTSVSRTLSIVPPAYACTCVYGAAGVDAPHGTGRKRAHGDCEAVAEGVTVFDAESDGDGADDAVKVAGPVTDASTLDDSDTDTDGDGTAVADLLSDTDTEALGESATDADAADDDDVDGVFDGDTDDEPVTDAGTLDDGELDVVGQLPR